MTQPPDFDAMYAADPDPWDVATSDYEQGKIERALGLLGAPAYGLVWDAACGTGHLAERLLDRADVLVASDASGEAVRIAAELLGDRARVLEHTLPAPLPGIDPEQLDLVVLSEVVYYLDAADRTALAQQLGRWGHDGSELLLVNWAHAADDTHLSGEAAMDELAERLVGTPWRLRHRSVDGDAVYATWVRSAAEG